MARLAVIAVEFYPGLAVSVECTSFIIKLALYVTISHFLQGMQCFSLRVAVYGGSQD